MRAGQGERPRAEVHGVRGPLSVLRARCLDRVLQFPDRVARRAGAPLRRGRQGPAPRGHPPAEALQFRPGLAELQRKAQRDPPQHPARNPARCGCLVVCLGLADRRGAPPLLFLRGRGQAAAAHYFCEAGGAGPAAAGIHGDVHVQLVRHRRPAVPDVPVQLHALQGGLRPGLGPFGPVRLHAAKRVVQPAVAAGQGHGQPRHRRHPFHVDRPRHAVRGERHAAQLRALPLRALVPLHRVLDRLRRILPGRVPPRDGAHDSALRTLPAHAQDQLGAQGHRAGPRPGVRRPRPEEGRGVREVVQRP
mmetsp:Transcript_47673/g.134584  ORF Transcript_47673/g.134584 Transcript_47673/m.134584 type:complete len:305 (+) Transcript_47673:760-1674(+)